MTLALLAVLLLDPAQAARIPAPAATPVRKPDLADAVEGVYEGDVTSDSRGSSQSGVTITIRRVGKNLVEITSDYPRVPTTQIPLTQAMSSIIAARGAAVFLVERNKDPNRLDLSIDGASLVVRRP
jgi:hypothetical protein